MRSPLVTLSFIAGFSAFTAFPQSALAKTDYEAIVRGMATCSAIEDVAARVACYDGTMEGAKAALAADQSNSNSRKEEDRAEAEARFGSDTLPNRPIRDEDQIQAISGVVKSARQVQPGYYSVAFEDGTEWRFAESVPLHFSPPRRGTTVLIERGALGSYRMMIPGQSPVRVRRVK